MRKKQKPVHASAGLVAVAILSASTGAQAASDCTTFANPVYIGGASAFQPVLQALAKTLGSSVSIIYQSTGSCVGYGDVVSTMKDTTPAASYLDSTTGALMTCTVPAAGLQIDIGVSDVYPDTCVQNMGFAALDPARQRDVFGPVQAMTIAVPEASTENAISAEAAYVLFGYGGTNYSVQPWTDPTQIFVRTSASGTLNMIGNAIGLPANKWKNAVGACNAPCEGGTGKVTSALSLARNPNTAVGILTAQAIPGFNASAGADGGVVAPLKVLAYQHTGQSCGYLPDSDSTHFDKINVRQGRYAIWGPEHLIVNIDRNKNFVDGSGASNASVSTVINAIIATGPAPPLTSQSDAGVGLTVAQKKALIDAEASAYVVPWCAMQVTRTTEVGAESSYQAPEPCGCHYENVVGSTVSSYCQPCQSDTECTSSNPACRYGYCEAK